MQLIHYLYSLISNYLSTSSKCVAGLRLGYQTEQRSVTSRSFKKRQRVILCKFTSLLRLCDIWNINSYEFSCFGDNIILLRTTWIGKIVYQALLAHRHNRARPMLLALVKEETIGHLESTFLSSSFEFDKVILEVHDTIKLPGNKISRKSRG